MFTAVIIVGGGLLALGVGGIVADCVLTHIPAIDRWLREMQEG